MKAPRIMLAAPASGSGKTLVTCGLLQALINRNMRVSSFKCGPDYIDPMFHTKVIGTPSYNLDTYFLEEETMRYLFGKHALESDISVLEGVMGYYDGLAGISTEASAWSVAKATDTPVILVVNARGMSLSVVSMIRGFLEVPVSSVHMGERESSHICGVILNQTTSSMYPDLKREIEYNLPVRVFGYVPKVEDCVIESRHLGLVTPNEIHDIQNRLQKLAGILETTLDIDGILELAQNTLELSEEMPDSLNQLVPRDQCNEKVRIAVAKDEAFCFYYADNLELMEALGAELVPFSPIHDTDLPENIQGLLLGGGYPELYAKELSDNRSMRASIFQAIDQGLPYLAECGGFMYLHEEMEDMDHNLWDMVGVVKGTVHKTDRLGRFGYIQLTAEKNQIFGEKGCQIKAHEFHYFDSTNNGSDFHATKPYRKRNWDCIIADERSAVGFPHLYYYSNPVFIQNYLQKCREFQ